MFRLSINAYRPQETTLLLLQMRLEIHILIQYLDDIDDTAR